MVAPLFLLYDYSFRPAGSPDEEALDWAAEAGVVCTDEALLHPDPYPVARGLVRGAGAGRPSARLARVDPDLRPCWSTTSRCVRSPTRLLRYPGVRAVVRDRRDRRLAHPLPRRGGRVRPPAHTARPRYRDGVRFEEVSVGYPRQWATDGGLEPKLREILPGPPPGG